MGIARPSVQPAPRKTMVKAFYGVIHPFLGHKRRLGAKFSGSSSMSKPESIPSWGKIHGRSLKQSLFLLVELECFGVFWWVEWNDKAIQSPIWAGNFPIFVGRISLSLLVKSRFLLIGSIFCGCIPIVGTVRDIFFVVKWIFIVLGHIPISLDPTFSPVCPYWGVLTVGVRGLCLIRVPSVANSFFTVNSRARVPAVLSLRCALFSATSCVAGASLTIFQVFSWRALRGPHKNMSLQTWCGYWWNVRRGPLHPLVPVLVRRAEIQATCCQRPSREDLEDAVYERCLWKFLWDAFQELLREDLVRSSRRSLFDNRVKFP